MKIYYKFHNNSLPVYFENFPFRNITALTNTSNDRPRRLRITTERYQNSQSILPNLNPTIQIIPTNRKSTRNCIKYHIPQIINDNYLPQLATEKVHTHSSKGFNHYAKNLIINGYTNVCSIENCYICGVPS